MSAQNHPHHPSPIHGLMAEFNSAPYFPIDLKGLTALLALAPDADIRDRARAAIVRLIEIVARSAHHGVLTAAEQQLVKSLSAEKGRDLLKQVRTQLIEAARPVMEAMVQEATGVKVLSLHHDISTRTGEEVVLFTLAEPPLFRESKKK